MHASSSIDSQGCRLYPKRKKINKENTLIRQSMSSTHRPVTWQGERSVLMKSLPKLAAGLGKARLSALVVTTMLAGAGMSLDPAVINADQAIKILTAGAVGTGLASASAACLNQWLEVPFDGQMRRTQARELPRAVGTSPPAALLTGIGWGVLGVGSLLTVNPTAASLAVLNIFLYAGVYTPLKRLTPWNTHVGAIVGAVPPLIGTALFEPDQLLSVSNLVLPAVLFAWQFPHFYALSWSRKEEYARAGYWMAAVVNPKGNRRSAFIWALMMFPICGLGAWFIDSPSFILTSAPGNVLYAWKAYSFFKDATRTSAKSLFLTSLLHLPVTMGLLLLHRRLLFKHQDNNNRHVDIAI